MPTGDGNIESAGADHVNGLRIRTVGLNSLIHELLQI
jgi:hypothetical protein